MDEAHLLAKETLEEIRFHLNYKMDSHQPMVLIQVGQNELRDKLKLQRYAAIRQRIDLKCEIPQMDWLKPLNTSYPISHIQVGQRRFSPTKPSMKFIVIQQAQPEPSTKFAHIVSCTPLNGLKN